MSNIRLTLLKRLKVRTSNNQQMEDLEIREQMKKIIFERIEI